MNQCYEPFFPTEFLVDYLKNGGSEENRFSVYVAYRFLSTSAKEDSSLPQKLKELLSYSATEHDFEKILDYLSVDFYFSPSFAENSYDTYLLLCAIRIFEDFSGNAAVSFESLIGTYCPQIASTDFDEADLDFSSLIQTEADFYAALYLSFAKHRISFEELLPKFAARYWSELHFTCEDFVLYDFMNEYFGLTNCLANPEFNLMVDTLVDAVLSYNHTSISSFLSGDGRSCLNAVSSRFAGIKRFGSIAIGDSLKNEELEDILAGLLRYSAVYELRNNLFDFHLDEDKWITLDNWKEQLRWHYVQYANVFESALSSFYSACLSRELLKRDFAHILTEFSNT